MLLMTDERGRRLFRLIDKNYALEPCAYCKFHNGYLTVGLMKTHRCMARGCEGFTKIDCKYWEERRKRKERAKRRKHQLKYGALEHERFRKDK